MNPSKYFKITTAALVGSYVAGKEKDAQAELKVIRVMKSVLKQAENGEKYYSGKKIVDLPIQVNPTAAELKILMANSKDGAVRTIEFASPSGKQNIIAWDAYDAVHRWVMNALEMGKMDVRQAVFNTISGKQELNDYIKKAGITALAGTTVMVADPKEAEALFIGKKAKDFAKYNKFMSPFDKRATAEIADDVASLSQDFEKATTLGDALKHDEAFKNYPKSRDVKVTHNKETGLTQGSFDPLTNTINIDPNARNKLSTLLHEFQHHIDKVEGINYGKEPAFLAAYKAPTSLVKDVMERASGPLRESLQLDIQDATLQKKMLQELMHGPNKKQVKAEINKLNKIAELFDNENPNTLLNHQDMYTQMEKSLNNVGNLIGVDPGTVVQYIGKDIQDTVKNINKIHHETLQSLTKNRYLAAVIEKNDIRGMRDWIAKYAQQDLYHYDSSEVKARAVQRRMMLNEKQREKIPIQNSMDISPDKMIDTSIPMSGRQQAREGSLLSKQPYLPPRNVEVKPQLSQGALEKISKFEGGGVQSPAIDIPDVALAAGPLGGPKLATKLGGLALDVGLTAAPEIVGAIEDGGNIEAGMEWKRDALLGGLDWSSGDEKYIDRTGFLGQ